MMFSDRRSAHRLSGVHLSGMVGRTAGALATVLLWCRVSLVVAGPPNVVLLLSDDLGWQDLGCYGGPVRTPTLDGLAADGMRFTDFYAGAAVCSPSRAALLTGRTNVRASIYSWINDHDQRCHLPRSEVTLAELLQAGGYATAHFGKWHLGMPTSAWPQKPTPADHGFDYWLATANNALPSHRNPENFLRNGERVGPMEGYACDLVVQDAVDWLQQRSDDRPFYLNVWFHEPHAPLAAPADLVAEYGAADDPAAIYSATIANTDRAIGRLLQALKSVGALDNTLIIYSSDNGSYRADRVGPLRGTKGSCYEGGIRVPGIFRWPQKIPAGTVTDEPAGLIDILPTVCGLTGLDAPSVRLDGTDLSDVLTGGKQRADRDQPLFWLLPLSGPAAAVREGRYGLVAFRKERLPRNWTALEAVRAEIRQLLQDKGIFASETRGSTLDRQLFEGFQDREAERLRGRFIRLNQFHEDWIPALKQMSLHHFELYDLQRDVSQMAPLEIQQPLMQARLTRRLQELMREVLAEAVDWSDQAAAARTTHADGLRVHRLQSEYRSRFDAFAYLNRLPLQAEDGESQSALAGRLLGRLANQEGRVLIKLPPGMKPDAYRGFRLALEIRHHSGAVSCFACHQLPDLSVTMAPTTAPTTDSGMRNRAFSLAQMRQLLRNETHKYDQVGDTEASRLLAFVRSLRSVANEPFRQLILQATVMDPTGD